MSRWNRFVQDIDSFVDVIKRPLYLWAVVVPYILYLVAILGILYIDPDYLNWIRSIMQIAIAFILIVRFNPLKKKHELHEYDEQIIFGSALILLTNATITQSFVLHLRSFFSNV